MLNLLSGWDQRSDSMDVIWRYEQINDVKELMKAPRGNGESAALKICKADL